MKTYFHRCKGWTISCISVLININLFLISHILRHRVQCASCHSTANTEPDPRAAAFLSFAESMVGHQHCAKICGSPVLKGKLNGLQNAYKWKLKILKGLYFHNHTHWLARNTVSFSWEIMCLHQSKDTQGNPTGFLPSSQSTWICGGGKMPWD